VVTPFCHHEGGVFWLSVKSQMPINENIHTKLCRERGEREHALQQWKTAYLACCLQLSGLFGPSEQP